MIWVGNHSSLFENGKRVSCMTSLSHITYNSNFIFTSDLQYIDKLWLNFKTVVWSQMQIPIDIEMKVVSVWTIWVWDSGPYHWHTISHINYWDQVNSWKISWNLGMVHFAEINQDPPPYSILQHMRRVATRKLVPRNCLRHLQTTLIMGWGALVSEFMWGIV